MLGYPQADSRSKHPVSSTGPVVVGVGVGVGLAGGVVAVGVGLGVGEEVGLGVAVGDGEAVCVGLGLPDGDGVRPVPKMVMQSVSQLRARVLRPAVPCALRSTHH